MGIKDWFGGKKKTEYREKVADAVSDGKLTDDKRRELEKLRHANEVDHIASDKTEFRRSAYNAAVKAVKAGGRLTSEEEGNLEEIQRFLNLRDEQIDKTQREVKRLKAVTDIEQGQLPVVSPESTVLRGMRLDAGEIAHYSAVADLFDCRDPGAAKGLKLSLDEPFRFGSAAGQTLPLSVSSARDSGWFLLTSRRIIFRGARTLGLEFKAIPELYVYQDGMRIKSGSASLLIQFRGEGISDIVASLVVRLRKQS